MTTMTKREVHATVLGGLAVVIALGCLCAVLWMRRGPMIVRGRLEVVGDDGVARIVLDPSHEEGVVISLLSDGPVADEFGAESGEVYLLAAEGVALVTMGTRDGAIRLYADNDELEVELSRGHEETIGLSGSRERMGMGPGLTMEQEGPALFVRHGDKQMEVGRVSERRFGLSMRADEQSPESGLLLEEGASKAELLLDGE